MGATSKTHKTLTDLANQMAATHGLTKKLAREILASTFAEISDLAHRENAIVTIHGFGSFRVTEGGGYERKGVNIKRTRRVTFKCSRMQKALI